MILWSESICPECSTVNWVYIGDSDEFIDGSTADACECYKCGARFWLKENDLEDEEDDRDIDASFIEEGKEDPRS